MNDFTFEARTRVVRGAGAIRHIGTLARDLGAHRPLVVSESGVIAAGCAEGAIHALQRAGLSPAVFSDFGANPDSVMAERGRKFATEHGSDLIIGLGGGSSLDLAKAIGFLVSNGGEMGDYWGYGKAAKPLPPMLGVPTTTGTGSEAQSYALISDAVTHRKMACGAPSAAFRVAILDPVLAVTQPFPVRATSAFDAVAHVVETWVTRKRTDFSTMLSREAWRWIAPNFQSLMHSSANVEVVGAMQWGAYLAGWAIEQSMLGAAHACANPLTQRYGTVHGRALAILLPSVIEWNADSRYHELDPFLRQRVDDCITAGRLPCSLQEVGVPHQDLPELAAKAAEQWTGGFNPRRFDEAAALEIYRCAY